MILQREVSKIVRLSDGGITFTETLTVRDLSEIAHLFSQKCDLVSFCSSQKALAGGVEKLYLNSSYNLILLQKYNR